MLERRGEQDWQIESNSLQELWLPAATQRVPSRRPSRPLSRPPSRPSSRPHRRPHHSPHYPVHHSPRYPPHHSPHHLPYRSPRHYLHDSSRTSARAHVPHSHSGIPNANSRPAHTERLPACQTPSPSLESWTPRLLDPSDSACPLPCLHDLHAAPRAHLCEVHARGNGMPVAVRTVPDHA